MAEIFGYEITKKVGDKEKVKQSSSKIVSPIPYDPEVGGISVSTATGGYYGQVYDLDGTHSDSENDLIIKYREAARQPECDTAISDIVDAAIATANKSAPVDLRMDDLDFPTSVKKEIIEEFNNVLELLKFNKRAHDIFKDWYVDGRVFFHMIVDPAAPKKGILELRPIEPLAMQRVREIKKVTDPKTKVEVEETVAEYYIYSEKFKSATNSSGASSKIGGVKIAKEAIITANSGLTDPSRKRIVSHLHKAIKLVNQLRMMEDSLVVYRVSRAPERRIFYIDVGNLPKNKAEEYVQNVVSKYRNKLTYDVTTGDITDDRRHMSMLEDFYLPRREGGRGTEITTLSGGENLGQIEDVVFFQKKLFKALNVPVSRLEDDASNVFGRASEISRDEITFQKFIDRLRKQFSNIILDSLRAQLVLKGIIQKTEWPEMAEKINIDFVEDNYYAELKEYEILKERLAMASEFENLIGKYYSVKWLRQNILQQTEEDIDRMNKEIEDEIKSGKIASDDEEDDF
tara:strand:- start:2600 stop:4144 length:1545 start_codon:yes stop_codon:yes gene_type:complete